MRLISLSLLCSFFVVVAEAQPAPALQVRIDSLFSPWDKAGSPGCVLGIIQQGELWYARSYGEANLDYSISIDPAHSRFYVASTSKQFTAACIALLALEGKLSPDDDIRRFLPEFPDYGMPIRIHHLVHHTSGIRDYLSLMQLGGKSFEDYFNLQDALQLLQRQRALNFQPGEEYLYSNSGYVLLALIVERASGMSLRKFAARHFFDPLGMSSTFFNDDHLQVVPGRVISYRPNWPHGFRQFVQHFDAVGDGNLLTTLEDLVRWDQQFYLPKVGGKAWLDLMHSPGVLNNGDTTDYAYGLRLSRYRGLRTVEHGGSMLGFRTQMIRFPEQELSIILLANVSQLNAPALALQVADRVLEGRFPAPRPNLVPPVAPSLVSSGPAFDLGKFDPRPYVGTYYSPELDVAYTLFAEGQTLRLRVGSREPVQLTPTAPDAFSTLSGQIRFRRAPNKRLQGFDLSSGRVRGIVFEAKAQPRAE